MLSELNILFGVFNFKLTKLSLVESKNKSAFKLDILKDSSKHGNYMVPNIDKYYDFIYQEVFGMLQS